MTNAAQVSARSRSFTQLSIRYQRAIVLKADGYTYIDIADVLKKEYKGNCSVNTVNQWFSSGGLLERATEEFTAEFADQIMRESRNRLKVISLSAIRTLDELLCNSNPTIRLKAATIILNKYIPDGQKQNEANSSDLGELPPELSDVGDLIASEPSK